MRSGVILLPSSFPGNAPQVSTRFVGCGEFMIRRGLLDNSSVFADVESLTSYNQQLAADDQNRFTINEATDQTGANWEGFFTWDKDLGQPRIAYRRTALFISDADGDGILFVGDNGTHEIFNRKYVELFNVEVLYRVGPDDSFWYVDAETPDEDASLLLMPSDNVQLPPAPKIAVWGLYTAGEQPADDSGSQEEQEEGSEAVGSGQGS